MAAADRGHDGIIDLLIERGASVNRQNEVAFALCVRVCACVCVRACACVCVHACMRACMRA